VGGAVEIPPLQEFYMKNFFRAAFYAFADYEGLVGLIST